MNTLRGILMMAGVGILLIGAYLFYFQADLDRWVSIGIVTAGILVFVGVCVMMFAGGARADPAPRSPGVVQDNREVVQRNDPR